MSSAQFIHQIKYISHFQVASISKTHGLTQLSYASTTSELSDKHKYPTFLRTVPSDTYQIQVLFFKYVYCTNMLDNQLVEHTVYSKRNAHLIPIFFVAPLMEGNQKFTWSIM